MVKDGSLARISDIEVHVATNIDDLVISYVLSDGSVTLSPDDHSLIKGVRVELKAKSGRSYETVVYPRNINWEE